MHETTYRTCGRVVVRSIGDETLLVPVNGPPAGARVYPVNPTALAVWRCLAAGGSVRQAAGVLAQRFAVPSFRQALTDCESCAQAFVEESLLEEQTA
jgi:hypothetical protein